MNAEGFTDLLDSLAAGWAAREYDQVIDHFRDDVFYCDPTRYKFTSSAQLLEFFRGEEADETCTFRDFVFDEARQIAAAEYTYEGTNRYHGTVWITLVDDKIARWREYQHTSNKGYAEFWQGSDK